MQASEQRHRLESFIVLGITLLANLGCSSGTSQSRDAAARGGGAGANARGGADSLGDTQNSPENGGSGTGGTAVSVGPTQPERITSANRVLNLIVKDGFVYYGDSDEDQQGNFGHLVQVPVGGGTPTILARGDATMSSVDIFPMGIAADATSIYWTDWGSSMRLAKTPIQGGVTVTLWSDTSCSAWGPVALQGNNVYWFQRCGTFGGGLMTVPTAGGDSVMLGSGTSTTWTPGAPGSNTDFRSLVVGDGRAFWTNPTGSVVSLPLTGGDTPTALKSLFEVSGPSNIVLARNRVFVTLNDYKLQNRGAVWSMNQDGSDATAIAKNQNIEVDTALAVDDTHVFWAVNDSILRATWTGENAVTLAASLQNPRALAVDACCVYWTDDSGGIWRMNKLPP